MVACGEFIRWVGAKASVAGAYAPVCRGEPCHAGGAPVATDDSAAPCSATIGPLLWPRGAGGYAPVAEAPAGVSDSAAPIAIAFFGSASTATARPSCSDTIWATSGIRDDPPTSSTA